MKADRSLSGTTNSTKKSVVVTVTRPPFLIHPSLDDATAEAFAADSRAKAAGRKPSVKVLAEAASQATAALTRLVAQVDDLYQLRDLLRKSQVAEKALTAELVAAMQAAGLDTLPGAQAVATLGSRTNLLVDVELFIGEVGLQKALQALTVKIEPARELVSGETLAAMSQETTTPVLYVKAVSK